MSNVKVTLIGGRISLSVFGGLGSISTWLTKKQAEVIGQELIHYGKQPSTPRQKRGKKPRAATK